MPHASAETSPVGPERNWLRVAVGCGVCYLSKHGHVSLSPDVALARRRKSALQGQNAAFDSYLPGPIENAF